MPCVPYILTVDTSVGVISLTHRAKGYLYLRRDVYPGIRVSIHIPETLYVRDPILRVGMGRRRSSVLQVTIVPMGVRYLFPVQKVPTFQGKVVLIMTVSLVVSVTVVERGVRSLHLALPEVTEMVRSVGPVNLESMLLKRP